jgi:hypothetical protein
MIKSYDLFTNKNKLWEIYNRCDRSEDYYNPRVASTTNVFIDDADDCAYIEQNIINPLGIPDSLLKNQYDDSVGYNFNVIKPGSFVNPHRDVNNTKVNILLNQETKAPFLFVETQQRYYYERPVLLDVSRLHTVENCESITQDRVTLQLFLTQPYEECKRIINENRTYRL